MVFFCDSRVLGRKLATRQFVWPPNVSLYASSTCAHLRLLVVRLERKYKNLKIFGCNRPNEKTLKVNLFKTKTSVKIRATVIPSEGYDYFRRSQGAWNHITTYFI